MVPTHASGRGSRLDRVGGLLMRDMALTHDEVVGLMAGLLTSGEPAEWHDEAERLAGRERGRPRGDVTCLSCGVTSAGSGHRDGAGKGWLREHGRHCRRPAGFVIILWWRALATVRV